MKISSKDNLLTAKNNTMLYYRMFNIEVLFDQDPGKDDVSVHNSLVQATKKKMNIKDDVDMSLLDVKLIRKVLKFGIWIYLSSFCYSYNEF